MGDVVARSDEALVQPVQPPHLNYMPQYRGVMRNLGPTGCNNWGFQLADGCFVTGYKTKVIEVKFLACVVTFIGCESDSHGPQDSSYVYRRLLQSRRLY